LRKPPHVGCLVPAGSLIKDDGVSLSLRESQVASNARDAGRFGLSGDVRRVRMSLRIRFGRTLWTGLHGLWNDGHAGGAGLPCSSGCKVSTTR